METFVAIGHNAFVGLNTCVRIEFFQFGNGFKSSIRIEIVFPEYVGRSWDMSLVRVRLSSVINLARLFPRVLMLGSTIDEGNFWIVQMALYEIEFRQ